MDQAQLFERLNAMRAAGGGRQAQRERFAALAQKIEHGGESDQFAALTEICDSLNMATEDIVNGMRADVLVPPIVACLRVEQNTELVYLAVRVLTYMCDSIGATATCIIRCEGIPLLCEQLLVIKDIELAEQCISCLEKIAAEHPGPVLEAGAATALITFIDFFNSAVQRKALGVVAQIAKRVTVTTFHLVQGILPRIRQFMQSDDLKLAEGAIVALSRIAAGVKTDVTASVELFGEAAPLLIEIMERHRQGPLFSAAVRFLADVSESAAVVEMLIELGIPVILAELLSTGALAGPPSAGSAVNPSTDISGTTPPPPVTLTPPRAGHNADSPVAELSSPLVGSQSKPALARLTPEAVCDVTSVLKNLLPSPQVDFLLYMDGLVVALHEPPRRRALEPEVDEEMTGDNDEEDGDSRPPFERLHDPRHRETLNQILEAHGIHLVVDPRWMRCRAERHVCDSCGKPALKPGDWYRSNDRDDFDLCQRCLILSTGSTTDTFTDMAVLLETTPDTPGSELPVAREPRVSDKQTLLQRSPYLLERIADVIGVVVDVAMDTDHPGARRNAIEFVLRLVAQAEAGVPEREAVVFRLLHVPAAGPFIASLLQRSLNTALGEVAAGVFIAQKCAEVRPSDAAAVFAREGVLHALSNLRTARASAPASPTAQSGPLPDTATGGGGPVPLHVATASDSGWRTLLSERASVMLNRMAVNSDTPALRALNAATDAVRTRDWSGAAFALAGALDTASSFELLHCGVTDTLVGELTKLFNEQPIDHGLAAATIFAATLWSAENTSSSPRCRDGVGLEGADASAGPPLSQPSSTALHKLLRHFQALIAQLDVFGTKPPQPPQPFRLIIAPHNDQQPDSPAEVRSPTTEEPEPSNSEGGGRRSSRRERSRGRSQTAALESMVSIEPLATIGAVADYIASRMLNVSPLMRSGPREQLGENEDDEDSVEDILPESNSKAKRSAANASASASRDAQSAAANIHIRYGKRTLPHSLSMMQVMQQYVPKNKRNEPIHLFFKHGSPFGGDIESFSAVTNPTQAYLPNFDSASLFRAAKEAKEALVGRLLCEEKSETGGAIFSIIRLLRLINVIMSNRESTVDCLGACSALADSALADACATLRLVPSGAISTELINSKLTNKVLRFIDGPSVIGQLLDSWCLAIALDCPFLFPTATRRLLFEVGYFGTSRAMARLLEHCKEMDRPVTSHHRNHRVAKKKVRVWRDRPLECAVVLMELHGLSRSWLDVQFYGEAGSGLGPTHEFYTLVGEQIRSPSLHAWRGDGDASFESSTAGLFLDGGSRALVETACSQLDRGDSNGPPRLTTARFLGRFFARSIIDQHVINVRLSPSFHRLLRGDDLVMDDMRYVAPEVYRILYAIVKSRAQGADCVDVGGAPVAIESLGLTFTLPGGSADVELIPDGANTPVTKENALHFVLAVSRSMLCDSVRPAAVEFREAFNEVLSLKSLLLFDPVELDGLFCGHQNPVSADEWAMHCVCDHGFTSQHPTVRMLFEELGTWSFAEQMQFIQFLTGAPLLPVGGLAALRPKMTVVRKKLPDGNLAAEVAQLPSAMTCQNFLKLPAYETREMLASKLRQAVQFGGGAFHFT